ncbi:Nuclear aminoacylation-dependent tRNA export pathway component [Exophiala xenobiotica]|nr:Nuclear aminoacylation-dependent tRNA export pathway component [Exophiala xenobiotica]KAK5341271.1 Nuclear aminoacylation-dependent tRNA export pathway component [Exophiala xenobiotica]KAK5558884.1 Nuclear aminoacylation-dependent tRNA export pathway component [Exophiala xenobiotica]
MDFLKSAVASAIAKSSSFPVTIGDRIDAGESIWVVHNGVKKDDNTPCCLFTFDINKDKARLPLAKNAARKLRTLRHPGVVRVIDVIENETNIYIITEKVTPLGWHIKRKSLSEETIKWGLYSISSTLKFINNEASSVHGAVRVSSIYTSESGEWKLGGFEVLSSMNEDDAIIYTYGSLLPDSNRYAPPEVVNGGWSAIKKNPLGAPDAYGLGILVFEAFNGSFMGNDQLNQPRSISANMIQSYRRLVNSNPKLRLTASQFVDQGKKTGGFFETPLIHITEGADSLGLKSEEERDQFLGELDELTDDFPEDFFKMKILPELLKSVEFGGGGPSVFGAMMKIGLKMSDDEFESRLGPVIIRLFNSPDRAMRVCLLDNLPLMVDRIPQKDVNGKIWPAMTTGFTDTAPVVREQTVKGVLSVISKLSDRVINGELLRFLAKTASDEQPGIRTNTIICLGKISRNLGVGSRSKVLIAAFSRALRDPFVHARNAALMTLNATIDVFSDDDCATKILPAICVMLVDKEKLVRDQANKALDSYLQRVRKYASAMPDTVIPPEGPASTATAAAPARMGNQNDTGWAGWAISSFTNKLAGARGEMAPTAAVNGSALTQTQSLPASGRATPSINVVHDKPVSSPKALATHTPRSSTSQPPEVEAAFGDDSMDAWGTMDDDGDNFFDASSNRSTKMADPGPAANFDDGGEPDFAGWLAAQSKAKTPKQLPKGLNKPNTTGGNLSVRPSGPPRSASAGVGNMAKRPAVAAARTAASVAANKDVKKEAPKPKEPDINDDDWGADWE